MNLKTRNRFSSPPYLIVTVFVRQRFVRRWKVRKDEMKVQNSLCCLESCIDWHCGQQQAGAATGEKIKSQVGFARGAPLFFLAALVLSGKAGFAGTESHLNVTFALLYPPNLSRRLGLASRARNAALR